MPGDVSQRGDLYHVPTAVTVESQQRLFFVVETALDSNADRAAGKSFVTVGQLATIYTVRPGLDVDVGFRARLNATGPVQQWLVRITVPPDLASSDWRAVLRRLRVVPLNPPGPDQLVSAIAAQRAVDELIGLHFGVERLGQGVENIAVSGTSSSKPPG